MEHIPVIRNKDVKEVLPDKWFQISVADCFQMLRLILSKDFSISFSLIVYILRRFNSVEGGGGGGEDTGERRKERGREVGVLRRWEAGGIWEYYTTSNNTYISQSKKGYKENRIQGVQGGTIVPPCHHPLPHRPLDVDDKNSKVSIHQSPNW